MKSEFLNFTQIPYDGKTKRFDVDSKSGEHLGTILWIGAWRKYVFFTSDRSSIFDTKCLNDIVSFINELMEERKNKKTKS